MKTNLFKSLLVAAMAVGAMGGVNAQTTTAFSQDFTAKTSESGVVSTDPADYGFTKLNFVGNYTVANITDGKFTTKVGGTDRSHTENGTVEYCANFDAIGKGNIVTISFYWETGNATGRSNSTKSQIYISNSNGDKVLDIAFYGQDKLLKINNTTTKAMNRNSKVNVTSKINLSTNVIEELKVGTNTFENIPFMTNDANDISKFVFLHTSGTKTSWSNESSIDNINITYEKLTVASANYTIKFVDENGNNIKTNIIKSSLVGENPIITEDDKSSFYNEDGTKKYIYVSDDAASKTIAEDGSTVVTVTYREAATYKYTVNNNINDYSVSGTAFEGDNAKVAFSQYILKDGVLYETNKIDNGRREFNWTFAVNEDNTVKTLNYKKTTINNVAYYSEGENIDGLTIINSGNSAVRSSNSASAYAKDADVVFTTLPAGKYKLISVVYKGSSANATFSYKAGEKVIFTHKAEVINSDTKTSEEFTLNESTPISLVKGGNESQGVDYIYIQRTGDETVSVSAAGYATYATKYNVEVPDNNDVEVMTVTVNKDNSSITLHEVAANTVIPANTGILVKAAKGDYNFAVTSKEGTPLENNNLVAATTDKPSNGTTYFALTKIGDKVGFALVANGVVIPAGKAYLEVANGTAGPAAKFFGLDGEATGINSVKTAKADGAYYTLEGVKTTKPVKGLYIHNGKKIVVK